MDDALESNKPSDVQNVVHKLRLLQLEADLDSARILAQRRSGARGKDARTAEIAAEASLAAAQTEGVYVFTVRRKLLAY